MVLAESFPSWTLRLWEEHVASGGQLQMASQNYFDDSALSVWLLASTSLLLSALQGWTQQMIQPDVAVLVKQWMMLGLMTTLRRNYTWWPPSDLFDDGLRIGSLWSLSCLGLKLCLSKTVLFSEAPLFSHLFFFTLTGLGSSLGSPGEGPLFFLLPFLTIGLCSSFLCRSFLPLLCLSSPFLSGAVVNAMPLQFRSARDAARAGSRANVGLIPGRQVLPVTNYRRASLLAAFISWT